jgi:hypothetical protein
MEDLPNLQETKSNERRNIETPPDMEETMRSLKVELQSCREDNEKIIKYQEEHNELNVPYYRV